MTKPLIFRLITLILSNILIASTLNSCSSVQTDQVENTTSPSEASSKIISSLRLYLAKGSFSTTEFEQFSLTGNSLFFECGKIRNGKNIPNSQGVVKLSETTSSDTVTLGMEILGRAATSDPLSLTKAGDLKGFADSGKVTLNLTTKDNKTAEINTGLNEVSEPLTNLERSLLKITKLLRAEVKNTKGDSGLCGNAVFFGIE